MAKEYQWKAVVDGQTHEILCVPSNNRYHIYDNLEYITSVYRKLFSNARGGMDETVTIAGKPCHFVIWDGQPDLEVDGQLLRAGCSYEEGREKYQKSLKVAAITWFCFAALFAGWAILQNWDLKKLFIAAVFVAVGRTNVMAYKKVNGG